MDGYQLQIEELGNLIDDLAHAAERISFVNDVIKDASEEQLGHEELDDAGRSFQDRWEHGTKCWSRPSAPDWCSL